MRAWLRSVAAGLLLAGSAAALLAEEPQTTQQTAPVQLTVDQAVSQALANQPLIQQAEAAVEAARARVGEANSAYYPFVSGNASYNRLSDQSFALSALLPPASTLQQLGISIPPNIAPLLNSPLSLVPVNMWDFNVGLNQVIFQFGKRGVQVKLAENGLSAAQIGVEQIRMSLAFQAAQGFYTVLFLGDQVAALDSQMANLQEHLEATRVKAQTGTATRYDELSTEVRISTLQSQRIEAESQLTKQSIALKQLLGMPESVPLDMHEGFISQPDALQDQQTLLDLAMQRRPEIRQAVESERAAELSKRLSVVGGWPTISGHASIGYKNGILPDINTPALNWVAGVQVNVPIFEGFLIARQGEEADKRLLAARENTLTARRNVTTQVLQAMQDVEAGRQQVQSAQTQLDQAKEMLEVVKLQYDLGMLSNLEYLDAQAAMERAQLESLQAQYREVLSEYALKQATGAAIWQP
ncbi:MAG: TolC family protein [Spirochaetia bacterium]|jgi:outer membrane protein TolC